MVVETPPSLDGALDDACWQSSPVCASFYLHGREGMATETTVAYLCRDEEFIYVAFDCRDSQPQRIVALQRKRGGQLDSDDHVVFRIDPVGDGQDWYTFQVSAAGTQSERAPAGRGSKVEWRGDWSAAARITDHGWQVEMAIPFSMLTYPRGASKFVVCFERYLAREYERSVWPYVVPGGSRGDRPAVWAGLAPPRLRRPPVAMPYTLLSWGEWGQRAEAGLDLKHIFLNGVTMVATLRPDFRSIEQEVESIDFSYVERRLSDRRPFFAEGGQAYFPDAELLYTRRIEKIDAGLKAFGRQGAHRFGVLAAGAAGASELEALRYSYEPTRAFAAWVSAVNYTAADQRHGLAGDVGVRLRIPKPDGDASFALALLRSSTNNEPGGSACHIKAGRERGYGKPSYYVALDHISRGFDPVVGYVPENGVRAYGALIHYSDLPDGKFWRRTLSASLEGARTADDERYRVNVRGALHRRDGTLVGCALNYGRREGFPDRVLRLDYAWNDRDLYRYGGMSAAAGEKAGGGYRYLGITQGFRPSAYLSWQVSCEYLDHRAAADPRRGYQAVLQTAYDFSPEKTVSMRIVSSDGVANVFVAYRRVVRAGLDTYVLFGDPNAETTQAAVAVKFVSALVF